ATSTDRCARVMALLLYGAGLRLLECCRLRIKDVDFATNQITIRDGKGGKDRRTMLPAAFDMSPPTPGPRADLVSPARRPGDRRTACAVCAQSALSDVGCCVYWLPKSNMSNRSLIAGMLSGT